ncbi:hypothetical protein EV702DRAFT_1199867 [Suillus placidus]|uniref:Uncharacterized protein n=1 Tax=Suillus placidus TaxID=48579 RepID=A0A9P6ZQQ4_9AGAM|nr:hypothetical protein EV702DRAFT_1199867 [Suillus placidus]
MLSPLAVRPNPSSCSTRPDYVPINHSQPTQNDALVGKRSCNDCSRIMDSINPNQPSLSDNHPHSRTSISVNASPSLPPVTSYMSRYAKCATSRFNPYQLGADVPTTLEHRFMMKNISKGNDVDLSQVDVQQGKEIFKRGMKDMTDTTVESAVIAKRADGESKRLRALATAWELESTEKHAILLQTLLRDNAEQYLMSLTEASFFEGLLVKCSKQQLEDDADFTIAAYSYDFAAHRVANLQLAQLEEVSADWGLIPEDDVDSGEVEDRLVQCLDNISEEMQNNLLTPVA